MHVCDVRRESALRLNRGVICAAALSCVKGTMSPRREFPVRVARFNAYNPEVGSGTRPMRPEPTIGCGITSKRCK